jgi:hypothetical protein
MFHTENYSSVIDVMKAYSKFSATMKEAYNFLPFSTTNLIANDHTLIT